MRRGGRDEEPPVREWLQGPPRGWGDDDEDHAYGARDHIAYDVGADHTTDYTADFGALDWPARVTDDGDRRGRGERRGREGRHGGGERRAARGRRADDRYRALEAGGGYEVANDDTSIGLGAVEPYVPGGYGAGEPDRDRARGGGRRSRAERRGYDAASAEAGRHGAGRHGSEPYAVDRLDSGRRDLDRFDSGRRDVDRFDSGRRDVDRFDSGRRHGDRFDGGRQDDDPYGGGRVDDRDGYGLGLDGADWFGDDYPRRRRLDEEYVPRRAANEPPRRPGGRPDGDDGGPGARTDAKGRNKKRRRKQMPLWQEMPLLLIVAFCLAVLIRTFLVQAFFIPSTSMTDTLLVGDRVLVNKVVYDMRDPRRGEIVVFSGTDSWVPEVPAEPNTSFMTKLGRTVGDLVGVTRPGDKDFIKRVIGVPGDRVSCCDAQGRVQVNGKSLDEPYVIENSPLDAPPNPRECRSRRFDEVVVQPGQMWVMGDHRLVSQDARCQGPVPIKNVIGKAFVVVWPKKSWATLPTPSTFDDVPPPKGVTASGTLRPVSEPPTGIFGIVMPILLALVFPARTRRNFSNDRRRLAE